MKYTNYILPVTMLAASLAPSASAEDVPQAPSYVDLAFITHLDANLPEQDVFIERRAGSGEVFRVTAGDNDMNAPLYAARQPIPHNPFSEDAVGPYERGAALGLTLGAWLRHRGQGRYRCTEGRGSLDLSFEGLVPLGVYTMWHAFIPNAPTKPFTGTLDLPLGAADGSESVFIADADGKARFEHDFRPCLELSDVWTASMLAINYHSDGKTYGGDPGKFGFNAHIPLFAMLPKREGIE